MYGSVSDYHNIACTVSFMNATSCSLSGHFVPFTFTPDSREFWVSLLRAAPDRWFGVLTLTRQFLYFACTEDKLCNQTKHALTICSRNDSALFSGYNYVHIGVL
jgi:hypothetical protein